MKKTMIFTSMLLICLVAQAGYRVIGFERFYFYAYNETGLHKFVMLWNYKVPGAYRLPSSIYDEEYDNGYDADENPLPPGATLGLREIESQALKNQYLMTALEIPANYVKIGNELCSGCDMLESVTFLGKYDIDIGSSLFQSCPKLKNVKLPVKLSLISSQMFKGCSALETLDIPQGVTSIGGGAFSGCSSLSSLKLPRDLTTIDAYAFQNCTSLTSLEIPAGVTSISQNAFSGATNLKQLTFLGNAPTIKLVSGTKLSTLYSNGCVARVPEGATGFDVDKNGQWYGLTVERYSTSSWDAVTSDTTLEEIPGLAENDKSSLVAAGVSPMNIAEWAKGVGGVNYGVDAINLNAFLMNADNSATEFVVDEAILAAVLSGDANAEAFKTRFPNAKVEIVEVNEGALKCSDNAKFYRLKLSVPTQK